MGREQEAKTGREQMQGTVLVQSTAHRGTVCTFVRQKYQKRGGFRNAPSTSEGSALRKPRAKQGNRFLAHRLPSTARRRTPARCCTRCPAYAPAIKSPARYSAGRAKQHNPARSVKPFPPRRSPGRTLPGQEGVKGDTCLSPSPFSLPFGKKRKNPRSSMLCSSNKHRLLHLLSAPPTFLTSPRTCS